MLDQESKIPLLHMLSWSLFESDVARTMATYPPPKDGIPDGML